MLETTKALTLVSILASLALAPAAAQTSTPEAAAQGAAAARPPDLALGSIQDGAKHLRSVFTQAAERMSEEDYAFRPTAETRTLGQVLAHSDGVAHGAPAVFGRRTRRISHGGPPRAGVDE